MIPHASGRIAVDVCICTYHRPYITETLKAVAAPYAMMKFVPTGGITPENIGEYLKFGQVLACGGSWMVAKELLANKQFDKITELARQAEINKETLGPGERTRACA